MGALPVVLLVQVQLPQVGAGDGVFLSTVAVVLLVAVVAVAFLLRRPRHDHYGPRDEVPDIPLLFPADGAAAHRPIFPPPVAAARAPASAPPLVPPASFAAPAGDELDELVDGKTIRFYRPRDGTLQLLPGRLEIVEGDDRGQDIRFVRTPRGTPEVTFGRSDGPPYEHVQLRAPTVSRRHATMRMEGDRWTIRNLSRTNPVVVNGDELVAAGESRPLREGDRIEMGEVVFRFRER